MSTTMSDLASLQSSSEEAPDATHNVSKILDVEITAPLTSLDQISTRSPSLLFVQSDEMNPFQSAKDRVDRMNNSRSTPTASLNNPWRRDALLSTSSSASIPTEHPHLSTVLTNVSNRQRSQSMMNGDESIPLSSVKPGPVWPAENQLRVAYTYGIRREDGTYTRLVPADELSDIDFQKVPVTQGPEGMIVLPPPQVPRPERRDGAEEMIPISLIKSLPLNQPRRPRPSGPDPNDDTQMQIDTIVAASSSVTSTPTPPRRREKIYCDKWIHEGVCAFTQLGCKYKHEMPMDKATQMSLGLNHGLPIWYKRANGVQFRPEPPPATTPSPVSNRSNVSNGSWRKADGTPNSSGGVTLGISGIQGSPVGRPAFGPSTFGPIGPPSRQPSNNTFSMLDSDMKHENSESEDEGVVTWTGRKR